MDNNLSPELKDIVEMIHRYNATHNKGIFVYDFVGFKKDSDHKCIDCGDDCDMIDDSKSMMGAYGDKESLRLMLNSLRDMIEDEVDEDGFVNI